MIKFVVLHFEFIDLTDEEKGQETSIRKKYLIAGIFEKLSGQLILSTVM